MVSGILIFISSVSARSKIRHLTGIVIMTLFVGWNLLEVWGLDNGSPMLIRASALLILVIAVLIVSTFRFFRYFKHLEVLRRNYKGYHCAKMTFQLIADLHYLTFLLLFCFYRFSGWNSKVLEGSFFIISAVLFLLLWIQEDRMFDIYVKKSLKKEGTAEPVISEQSLSGDEEEAPQRKAEGIPGTCSAASAEKAGSAEKVTEEKVTDEKTASGDELDAELDPELDSGIQILYERFCLHMEQNKPYLADTCQEEEVARDLYTNKTYMSRMVNVCTGLNFPKLINRYRVEYSIELFKQDMHLKVSELSEMSGFHSTVTYNMAFKFFMNESPSDWCHAYKREHLP